MQQDQRIQRAFVFRQVGLNPSVQGAYFSGLIDCQNRHKAPRFGPPCFLPSRESRSCTAPAEKRCFLNVRCELDTVAAIEERIASVPTRYWPQSPIYCYIAGPQAVLTNKSSFPFFGMLCGQTVVSKGERPISLQAVLVERVVSREPKQSSISNGSAMPPGCRSLCQDAQAVVDGNVITSQGPGTSLLGFQHPRHVGQVDQSVDEGWSWLDHQYHQQ